MPTLQFFQPRDHFPSLVPTHFPSLVPHLPLPLPGSLLSLISMLTLDTLPLRAFSTWMKSWLLPPGHSHSPDCPVDVWLPSCHTAGPGLPDGEGCAILFTLVSPAPNMTRRGAGPKLDKLLNFLTQDKMGENTKFLGEVGDSEINMQGPGLINVSSFSS